MKNKVVPGLLNLFVAQSLDRIQVGCLLGRIPSEEHSGQGTYGKRKQDAPGLDKYRPVSHTLDNEGCSTSQYDANQTSGDTDQDGFDQELGQDVYASCSY